MLSPLEALPVKLDSQIPLREKKSSFDQGVKPKKVVCDKKYILQKKLGQNGHSSPQQWSEQSTLILILQ